MPGQPWLVLTIRAPSAEHAAILAEGLFAAGAQAVEERPDRVITYLQLDHVEPGPYLAALARDMSGFNDGIAPDIEWAWLPDQDWSETWKRGLAPRRVGKRLIVAPTWTDPEVGPDDLLISIDPQMAFGTGEHASTRGALRLIEQFLSPGARVLDVGTGSAVLAIAAVLLGARAVLGVEADTDSLINARENLERNGVTDRVVLDHRLADAAYLKTAAEPPFDLVTANILNGVIIPLLDALRAALMPMGTLIVAGILQEEAAHFLEEARARGLTVLREDREELWWSAALRRAPAAKPANR